jgi:hypothetical protein
MTRHHPVAQETSVNRTALATAAATLIGLAAPLTALAAPPDRNHDGLPDTWETRHHLSLKTNQARQDRDHDGLNNKGEFRRGTNPNRSDSDRDGLTDGAEVKTGNNPRRADTDGDGIKDGAENAGVVESLADGVLTIKLANGRHVSGRVTTATSASCDDENENEIKKDTTVHNRRGSDDTTGHAARNGSGGSDPSPTDTSPSGAQRHAGEAENENENETQTEAGGDDGSHGDCSTADMKPGAMVHEAEIEHSAAGESFTKVSIVR